MPRLISAVLLVLCILTVPALSQTYHAKNLKGYTRFNVVVEDLNEKARGAGLTVQNIKTKVELELRKNGITVDTNAVPFVSVAITVVGFTGHGYSVMLGVTDQVIRRYRVAEFLWGSGIRDSVKLEGIANLLVDANSAVIWSNSITGVTPRDRTRSNIIDSLQDLLDIFLNDYLAVNPKQ